MIPATAGRCPICGEDLTLGACRCVRRAQWQAAHPGLASWVAAWRIVGWRLWQLPGWARRLRLQWQYAD